MFTDIVDVNLDRMMNGLWLQRPLAVVDLSRDIITQIWWGFEKFVKKKQLARLLIKTKYVFYGSKSITVKTLNLLQEAKHFAVICKHICSWDIFFSIYRIPYCTKTGNYFYIIITK